MTPQGEYGSTNEVTYKSGGQVDGAMPLAEKFGPDVAATGKTTGNLSATPQWTFVCDGQVGCHPKIIKNFVYHHI